MGSSTIRELQAFLLQPSLDFCRWYTAREGWPLLTCLGSLGLVLGPVAEASTIPSSTCSVGVRNDF